MKRPSPAEKAKSPAIPLPPSSKKKTRDLPNLSDCHCCNRRINSTNPRNRLKILTSHWRIVLLCNPCHNLVESSRYCSYCLTDVSSSSIDSVFDCKRCRRRMHRNCVSRFLSGVVSNGEDLCVCFDCWVPDLIENDYRRARGGRAKKSKICEDIPSLGSSRVCDSQDKGKSLEDVANEANVAAQKKVTLANEAKENAAAKALVAKRAVDLANDALDLVVVDKGCDHEGRVVEDDAQLAFQLHRAINSSPRITRNLCLLNTEAKDVPSLRKTIKVEVEEDADVVDTNSLSCKKVDGLSVVETRQDCAQETGGTQDGKCNGDSSDCMITYTRRGRTSQDGMCKVKEEPDICVMRIYSRRPSLVERHNVERDHCSKTYSRRTSTLSPCKSYDGFNLERGILTSAIALNCCEQSRGFGNGS